MAAIKKIYNEELEKVDGGMTAAYGALKEEIRGMIPPEVQEKINAAAGDVAVCKILAENGIDVEKVEKKLKDAGFNLNKICLQEVPDDALANVSGGFKDNQSFVSCKCGNDDRDEFSWQWFASNLSVNIRPRRIYRCKKCNTYVYVYSDSICYRDELDWTI